MAHKRMHPWRLLPALLLYGCGGSGTELEAALAPAEAVQPVLAAPRTPPGGDVLDGTTYMGPVELGGAAQTRFTAAPQHLSFGFSARAGAQVRLEVTPAGSSPSLDTVLFVYGPRRPDGRYGDALLAWNDDSGHGQLSRVDALTLSLGGDYLVVVGARDGEGRHFRLRLDCVNGACAPRVDPALYHRCDWDVAYPIKECIEGTVEEYGVSLADAYDSCTGPDDAHAFYRDACGGPTAPPTWCLGGEAQFTLRMWPVCQDHFLHDYGL